MQRSITASISRRWISSRSAGASEIIAFRSNCCARLDPSGPISRASSTASRRRFNSSYSSSDRAERAVLTNDSRRVCSVGLSRPRPLFIISAPNCRASVAPRRRRINSRANNFPCSREIQGEDSLKPAASSPILCSASFVQMNDASSCSRAASALVEESEYTMVVSSQYCHPSSQAVMKPLNDSPPSVHLIAARRAAREPQRASPRAHS